VRVLAGDVDRVLAAAVITEAEIDELLAKLDLAMNDTMRWLGESKP
jgi:hypothetical protein